MATTEPIPTARMRRSAELAPLSRDHHVALAVALELRRVTPPVLPTAADRFRGFWQEHGSAHFDLEEAVLDCTLLDDVRWPALVARMVAEHEELRALAARFLDTPTLAGARALGEALRAHVRFEERVVFDLLERGLDAPARAAVGRALAH